MAIFASPRRRRLSRGAARRQRDLHATWLGNGLWILAIASAVVAMLSWTLLADRARRGVARDPDSLCRLQAPPPAQALVLLDQTDTLAGDSGTRFLRLLRRIKTELPKNGRLTIVPFGGDLGASLAPVFDICSPGSGREADELIEGRATVQQLYDRKFAGRLDRVAEMLQAPRTSAMSPIAEQIERALNDPAIPFSAARRDLYIFTDGLQHTPNSRIYRGAELVLPDPPAGLLRGIRVHYVELANARHPELQRDPVRETWRRWLEGAGGQVSMYAPGYAAPIAFAEPPER